MKNIMTENEQNILEVVIDKIIDSMVWDNDLSLYTAPDFLLGLSKTEMTILKKARRKI